MKRDAWLEEVVKVLNIIDGRNLWLVSEGNLCSFALAKAESIPPFRGNHTQVNQDVKISFAEDASIEQLEKAIVQAEESVERGKELLREMRQHKLEEAVAALTRAADKATVTDLLKQMVKGND